MSPVRKVIESSLYDLVAKKIIIPVTLTTITVLVGLLFNQTLKQTGMYEKLLERTETHSTRIEHHAQNAVEFYTWTREKFEKTDEKIDKVCNRVTIVETKIKK